MTPEVARKLHDLVAAGATIMGPRPTTSPSLLHGADADAQVRSLATDLWGDMDGVTLNQHAYGKGMTYWGITLDEVLHAAEDAAGLQGERLAGQSAGVGASAHAGRRHLLCCEPGR